MVEQPLEMARPLTEGRSLPPVEPVSAVPPVPVPVSAVPPVSVVPVSGSVGEALQTKPALQTPARCRSR